MPPPPPEIFFSSVGRDDSARRLESFRREFRRLRAATFFFHGEKEGKTPPGTRPMDYGSTSFRLSP